MRKNIALIKLGALILFWSLPARPAHAQVTWDWILSGQLPVSIPSVQYLGLDGLEVSTEYVQQVKAAGVTSWCYLSVGTAENFRADYRRFVAVDRRDRNDGNKGILGRK